MAQYYLGVCYYKGEGVKQDISTAVYWWTKSAEQGYLDAQAELADVYYEEGNYSEAVKWATNPAEQGYAQAQYILGAGYFLGQGVKQDYSKAVSLFSKSAEQGHAAAKGMLAFCYDQGNGVKNNKEKAFSLYFEAAKAGQIHAQNWMGDYMLTKYTTLSGNSVKKGIKYQSYLRKACDWYEAAARQGDRTREEALNSCRELLDTIDMYY